MLSVTNVSSSLPRCATLLPSLQGDTELVAPWALVMIMATYLPGLDEYFSLVLYSTRINPRAASGVAWKKSLRSHRNMPRRRLANQR